MAANYEPDDPIEGGRVYKSLAESDLQARANAGTSGYTVAQEFLTRIEGELKQDPLDDALDPDVKNGLSSVPIDALGFEVEVAATAANTDPFGLGGGYMGLSTVWFTDPESGLAAGPHVYLFADYRSGSVQAIRPAPNQSDPEANEGCFFVVYAGDAVPTKLSLVEWEGVLPTIGVGSGENREHPFLAGEAMLYSIPDASLLLLLHPGRGVSSSKVFYAFGCTFAVNPGEERPHRIIQSRYSHDRWLLRRLGFLDAPSDSSWSPPKHSFSKQGSGRVPHWAGTSTDRPRMSLVLSVLSEEDLWLFNRTPWTKYEEDDDPAILMERLEAYFRVAGKRSEAFSFAYARDESDAQTYANEAANDEEAWSAVFISYVVAKAGFSDEAGFAFSGRHMAYVALALANELNGAEGKKFRLHEATSSFTPEFGDILCKNRGAGFTIASIKRGDLTGSKPYSVKGQPGGDFHCDIVVKTETVNGTMYLETVGGNTFDYQTGILDTAGRKRWKQKASGDWVMVGVDDKELGSSSTPNQINDPTEPNPADRNPTIWEPSKDDVIGFIRYESK